MTDKKLKIEASVHTTKNVSSGIGRGFGMVIGIFLALIVIGVGCSIILSSNANQVGDQIHRTANELQKEREATEQKIREQNEQLLDKILPVDERKKVQDEGFKFSPDSIINTQNGISLSLDDMEYELKDDWGKITELTVTVLNSGNNNFQPKILVQLYDSKDRKEDKFRIKSEIDFDVFGLDVGEHVTKKAITNIGFANLNLTKKLTLILVDGYAYDNKAKVVVEKEFLPK